MTIKKKRLGKLIDFFIDSDLLARLDAFANEKGWTRSFTIREAIKNYIKKGD